MLVLASVCDAAAAKAGGNVRKLQAPVPLASSESDSRSENGSVRKLQAPVPPASSESDSNSEDGNVRKLKGREAEVCNM